MFLSIVHQLNPVDLNSKQHDLSATHLRAQTTQFISKNLSLFQHELKDRVFENFPNQKVHNMAEECQQFVDNTLSKEGVWGGHRNFSCRANALQSQHSHSQRMWRLLFYRPIQ